MTEFNNTKHKQGPMVEEFNEDLQRVKSINADDVT